MEHPDQPCTLHREQVAPRQISPQQANAGTSALRARQPAVEAFQREIEILEASFRQLGKSLEQPEIRQAFVAQPLRKVDAELDLEDDKSA